VDCHYNTTVTLADWYNAGSLGSCTYCHQGDGAYDALSSPLPNAHTVHVDEVAEGGYNYACAVCHPNHGANNAHEDGAVNVSTAGLPFEADTDATMSGGDGLVKYGGAGGYTDCANVYCH
jgi:hypothetical protein